MSQIPHGRENLRTNAAMIRLTHLLANRELSCMTANMHKCRKNSEYVEQ